MARNSESSLFDNSRPSPRRTTPLIKAYLDECKKVLRPLTDVLKLKASDPSLLSRFSKSIDKLPSQSDLAAAYGELRTKGLGVRQECQSIRTKHFREAITGFVTNRSHESSSRETGSGWRIGKLELLKQVTKAQVRFAYNRETLTPWQEVSTVEDVKRCYEAAIQTLDGFAIAEGDLADTFWRAYLEASPKKRMNEPALRRVLLREFYRGLRIVLFRMQLQNAPPGRKLKYAEFPLFAFLYNADRYISIRRGISENIRLAFETGSQQEVMKKKGMLLNGLDAKGEYKMFCYIKPAS